MPRLTVALLSAIYREREMKEEQVVNYAVKGLAGIWVIRLLPLAIVGALASGIWLMMGLPIILLGKCFEQYED